MCAHCKAAVERACMGVAGTQDAQVDLQEKTVTVIGTASRDALREAIENAGYQVIRSEEEQSMKTVITVNGMMCTHCKARVESICKAAQGVEDAVVDLQAKTVTVTGTTDIDALKKAIGDAGYEVVG